MASKTDNGNFHTLLTDIYQAVLDMDCRPESLILPHTTNPNRTVFPYMEVAFAGTSNRQTRQTGSSLVRFLIQIDIVAQNRSKSAELNEYIQEIWKCFPPYRLLGSGDYKAQVLELPRLDPFEATPKGNYRVPITIIFSTTVK
ncbi:MAG: hypothetical protein K0U41_05390 [Gammaproteobacteria bacterium]|nr:hypothetical protein [Gammaproteobacteria bacterium]